MNEPVDRATELFRLLSSIFVESLERFRADDDIRDEEKRARAFAAYAKSLETILTFSTKLNAAGAANLDPVLNGAGGLAPGSQAADTAELDRNLAQLVGNLVAAGKTG